MFSFNQWFIYETGEKNCFKVAYFILNIVPNQILQNGFQHLVVPEITFLGLIRLGDYSRIFVCVFIVIFLTEIS